MDEKQEPELNEVEVEKVGGVMTPAEPIILTISQGEQHIFEAEGHYDIWVHYIEDSAVVSIRNCVTDEIVFNGLGFEWMEVSSPFVDIQTRSS